MKNIIKAEMWDKMQYLFRSYYDRMIHIVLHYDKEINTEVLSNALICMVEKIPVLHSSFSTNPLNVFWKVKKYTINDILDCRNFENREHLEEKLETFITYCIPTKSNVQLRVAVYNCEGKSTFALLLNHMCFDGGDVKVFLKTLAKIYNSMLAKENPIVHIKVGSRSHTEVYTKLEGEALKEAKGLYKNVSQVKDENRVPFTPDNQNDICRIIRRRVDESVFNKFKSIGKRRNVTVNDLMLAVYIRGLYDIIGLQDEEQLVVPCMVDLRRHIIDEGLNSGFANHTGFMQCKVNKKGNDINETLVEVARSNRENKKDPFLGLYSLPLLSLAYKAFPFAISEYAIKIGYMNPLMGMSNIGVIDVNSCVFGDARAYDGFITGAIKYKPYMQLALTSLDDNLTMSIAVRSNDEDVKIINKLFDYIVTNIDNYILLNEAN